MGAAGQPVDRVERRSDDPKRSREIERRNGRHNWRNRKRWGKGDFDRSLDSKGEYRERFDEVFGPYCRPCGRCHKGACTDDQSEDRAEHG